MTTSLLHVHNSKGVIAKIESLGPKVAMTESLTYELLSGIIITNFLLITILWLKGVLIYNKETYLLLLS